MRKPNKPIPSERSPALMAYSVYVDQPEARETYWKVGDHGMTVKRCEGISCLVEVVVVSVRSSLRLVEVRPVDPAEGRGTNVIHHRWLAPMSILDAPL